MWNDILCTLNNYASLISASVALFAALVALYLGDWRQRLNKPKLKISFNENKKYPYFQTLNFQAFKLPINIDGQITDLYCPGFNARLRVDNTGKSTAKNVQAKVEKIEFYENGNKIAPTRHYHPTTVKWSGEREWKPVDIVPNSHFFLDVFYAKNETSTEIFNFNNTKLKHYNINLQDELLKEIIEQDLQPSEEVYWNVWVDNSYDRGLPSKYSIQGEIIIYFIINADNCSPIKFESIVNWSFMNWNQPQLRIRYKNKFINQEVKNA